MQSAFGDGPGEPYLPAGHAWESLERVQAKS